ALVSGAPGQSGEVSERHSIGDLLDRRAPVMLALVGQPGSGKSTLLAHAARRSAKGGVLGRRRRVPVLLALRECAASIAADPAVSLPDVIRATVGGAAGKEPGGWWERQLGGGRCLVLLDGLDEVARADERRAMAGWVEHQVAEYTGNHFVVTSRTYGLPDPLAKRADVLVVRPFTAEQVRVFLDGWYLAAEQHATGASGRAAQRAARMRAGESAARLLALLRAHPALQGLSVNPLLLTMIATAHRYRGALPGSRADLYGEICQVLLSRRAQAKDLPELLPWSAKQTLLAALAYQMMRDHVSEVSIERVLEVLGPQLERFPDAVTGEALLEDVARSGLLAEVSGGGYEFTHLTFQEYLAARHVSGTPDLVKSLADNVDDPWWHETILLYAAAADASPVVRACLDSGTIPALTLAFDCDEASAEIDPELRERLDRERRRAYETGCPPAHRRLIAGVQAARLVRRTVMTAAGTRICARPVPGDLYWLFLADTQAPPPDGPRVAGAEQPATGVWGAEAEAFVRWLNSITATATGIEVRLPRQDELQEEAVAGVLPGELPPAVTSAWTRPLAAGPDRAAAPGLWVRPGRPHPHELAGEVIRQAVAADVRAHRMLPQVLTAAVLDVAITIARDLEDLRALSSALGDDLAARANSGGQIVEIMHAHAHAIVHTYRHALDLTRADAVTHTCAADPALLQQLGLAPARALADAIAGDLAAAIDLARTTAAELAATVDQDLNVLSAFEFDLARAVELHRVHTAAVDRADTIAHRVPQAPGLDLAEIFGRVPALDPAFPVQAMLGLPLRWVADSSLASTLLQVIAARPAPGDPYLAFAYALSSRAGVYETTQLGAALGGPLTDALDGLAKAAPSMRDGSADWQLVMGLSRLADRCAPMSTAHLPPEPAEAAALRAVALALADGAAVPGADAPAVLRTAAATVTLVERRGKGESAAGESVILALV
ncbi:MAG TPA: NACHT domain-containing protein, partial [Trebonia sp.]|nr:NACHT domain-containing protein [Trebonia sp.]